MRKYGILAEFPYLPRMHRINSGTEIEKEVNCVAAVMSIIFAVKVRTRINQAVISLSWANVCIVILISIWGLVVVVATSTHMPLTLLFE